MYFYVPCFFIYAVVLALILVTTVYLLVPKNEEYLYRALPIGFVIFSVDKTQEVEIPYRSQLINDILCQQMLSTNEPT